MVGLGNVDNTSDVNKPISTAEQTALGLKASNTDLSLKAPIASPTFTGTVSGITGTMVGLGNVDNTSDVNKPISAAAITALSIKAPLASPTFTGTVTIPNGASLGTPITLIETNITGTAPALSIGGNAATATSATTATNLAGGAGGTIPYQSAAGTTAMLANGTSGQVLQSNGTTLAPSWTNAAAGDMTLASVQTVTGAKTFNATKLLLSNVANTFNGSFTNTNTADRIYTLKDGVGTLAFTSDITGTNSGTNTGDQTNINGNAGTVTTNANLTGEVTSSGSNATTVTNAAVIAKVLTGLSTTAGAPVAADNILAAIGKLTGTNVLKANLASPTFTGTVSGDNVATTTFAGFSANINAQTNTSYTLLASDNGKIITLNNASAITLTVPTLFAGFNCLIIQSGGGAVTLTASGTTIANRSSYTKTAGINAIATLIALSNTSFISSGDMK